MLNNQNRLLAMCEDGIREYWDTPIGEFTISEMHQMLNNRKHYRNVARSSDNLSKELVDRIDEHVTSLEELIYTVAEARRKKALRKPKARKKPTKKETKK